MSVIVGRAKTMRFKDHLPRLSLISEIPVFNLSLSYSILQRKGSNTVPFIFCVTTVVPNSTKVADEEKKFRDCADLYQAGFHKNAIYNIQINSQETKKVRSCKILQPAVHCNVNISVFSSRLGSTFTVGLWSFTRFL